MRAVAAPGDIADSRAEAVHPVNLGDLPPSTWRGIVDALAVGIVVIDDDWRLAHVNPAAAELLDSDAALTTQSERLVIRPEEAERRLRVWLACSGRQPGTAVAVARASGRPPVLFEYLSPLTSAAGSAMHLLSMLDTGQPPSVDADRLALAFGLTRAEARLMAALADGQTMQAVAHRQGVTVATVRTHLESVYAKTGARRQAQVVRLAMACAGPFTRRTPPPNSGVDRADKFLAIGS